MQDQIDTVNQRLATGKKVNSVLDNASAYFRAEGFQKESRDLGNLLDFMDAGLRTISKVTTALDSARKLIESAQSLARQTVSLSAGDANRDTYGAQATELINQAAKVLNDSAFGGTALLQTNTTVPSAMTIITNTGTTAAAQTTIAVAVVDMRFSAASGVGGAALVNANHGMAATAAGANQETFAYATGADRWSDATNGNSRANGFITWSANAITKLQSTAATLSTQASTIQIRKDFTKNWIRLNDEAADDLTLADMNAEGANLSALQTKQQLAVQALTLANRADQAILRLF